MANYGITAIKIARAEPKSKDRSKAKKRKCKKRSRTMSKCGHIELSWERQENTERIEIDD